MTATQAPGHPLHNRVGGGGRDQVYADPKGFSESQNHPRKQFPLIEMSPCLLFHSDLAGKGFSSGHCRQENRAFAKQAAQARSQQLSQLSPASTPRMAPHCLLAFLCALGLP